jgi:hypothetical protein
MKERQEDLMSECLKPQDMDGDLETHIALHRPLLGDFFLSLLVKFAKSVQGMPVLEEHLVVTLEQLTVKGLIGFDEHWPERQKEIITHLQNDRPVADLVRFARERSGTRQDIVHFLTQRAGSEDDPETVEPGSGEQPSTSRRPLSFSELVTCAKNLEEMRGETVEGALRDHLRKFSEAETTLSTLGAENLVEAAHIFPAFTPHVHQQLADTYYDRNESGQHNMTYEAICRASELFADDAIFNPRNGDAQDSDVSETESEEENDAPFPLICEHGFNINLRDWNDVAEDEPFKNFCKCRIKQMIDEGPRESQE